MSAQDKVNTLKRYRSYGLWGGLSLGIFMGVVVGGPQFREWENPLSEWGTLIVACAAVGSIVGFFFLGFLSPGAGSDDVGCESSTESAGGDDCGDGGGVTESPCRNAANR